jgi:serine/threonine-protein kinase
MTEGDIYTIAGDGTCGTAGNGESGTRAETCPLGVAVDSSGNVLITEDGRLQVLAAHSGTSYNVQMTAGDLYSVAGNGQPGFAGDGAPLATARFSGLFSLVVGPSGEIVIGNGPRLREITS